MADSYENSLVKLCVVDGNVPYNFPQGHSQYHNAPYNVTIRDPPVPEDEQGT